MRRMMNLLSAVFLLAASANGGDARIQDLERKLAEARGHW